MELELNKALTLPTFHAFPLPHESELCQGQENFQAFLAPLEGL